MTSNQEDVTKSFSYRQCHRGVFFHELSRLSTEREFSSSCPISNCEYNHGLFNESRFEDEDKHALNRETSRGQYENMQFKKLFSVTSRYENANDIQNNRKLLGNISTYKLGESLVARTSEPDHGKDQAVTVDITDLSGIDYNNIPIKESFPKNDTDASGMDWNKYHRLGVIHQFMDNLEYNHPSICSTGSIGNSLEGRDLKVIKISNSEATNAAVWLDGGIHAREWIAPAVATYVVNRITSAFDSLPRCITNKDWYILPVMNPDGYEHSHTEDRMWRKNRAFRGHAVVGVDLNRNFSVGWGGQGSSGVPTDAFYRGPEPFSEPESRALRDMLLYSGIKFKVYITLHCYGQIIMFPFSYKPDLCPDYIRLLEGATVMSKAIYEATGNTYKVGISKDVLYGAAGTSNDWSYEVANIPFCYLVELRSKKHRFKLPDEEIQETGNEIFNAILSLMSYVDTWPWESLNAINIWKEEHSTMEIMVEGPRAAQIAGMLHEREIPFSIAIGDVGSLIEKEQGNKVPKTRRSSSSRETALNKTMDWKSYHRLDVIYAFMDNLAQQFPYLCSVIKIGKSVEGRDLKVLKVSNRGEQNCGVWIDGAIHPREWISAAVVTYIADHVVRHFDTSPDYVTNKDWYFLPVMNPDGYEYSHTHDRMWRKNRARFGECIGVDLNRNFSYGWAEKGEEGSSDDPGNIFYRGPKPFSEPETDSIRRLISEAGINFKVFLSFHSYGEVIIFPWGYSGDPCPDYVELLQAGSVMAKAIHEVSGHTYKVGSTKDLMYYAAGTSTDWSYGVANIPYSYMVELRGKKHRFLLPKEEIIVTATEALSGVIKLLHYVENRCSSTQTCSGTCRVTK